MSRNLGDSADFERRLQALLQESVQRVGGRTRSRLTQARHAALAEVTQSSRWRLPLSSVTRLRLRLPWMPAAGAMAAGVLVAFVLLPHAWPSHPGVVTSPASVEDLDLIADRDGMDLVQNGDGQFYEWAMAQDGPGDQPAGATGQDKARDNQGAAADTKQNSG